jgi:hypothetical protein
MLPTALRFDLRPRATRRGLRLLLLALVAGVAAGAAIWLVPRQAELGRLRLASVELVAAAKGGPAASSASLRPAAWEAAADKDGGLFALPAEPRLLEIERCTDARSIVTRIVHDAAERATSLELSVTEPDALRELLGCLNESYESPHFWRLLSVEAPVVGGPVTGPLGQRVVLRHP